MTASGDPERLAGLADWRCKKSKEEIKASLQATWDEDHLFIMKQSDDLYHYYKDLIKDTEAIGQPLLCKRGCGQGCGYGTQQEAEAAAQRCQL